MLLALKWRRRADGTVAEAEGGGDSAQGTCGSSDDRCSEELREGPAQEGLREVCARTGLQEKGLGRVRMGVVAHPV